MAAAKPLSPQVESRLFALPADIRAMIWDLVFDDFKAYSARSRKGGYMVHAGEMLCKTTTPHSQLVETCRFAYGDCSPYLWRKAHLTYFDCSPRKKNSQWSLTKSSIIRGNNYIRSLDIVRRPQDWLRCDLWGLLHFPALQTLSLSQLLLCRIPSGEENTLSNWTKTAPETEEALTGLASKLTMTDYNRSRMQRNDRQFIHLVETVLRPSGGANSQLFACDQGTHNRGQRIVQIGRRFMLRGHQRKSPRGEKTKL